MARVKNLNIFNTDKKFNLQLTTKEKEADFIKVTAINAEEVENNMDELKRVSNRYNMRDGNTYMLYKQRYGNDSLNDKIINHGGFVKYYTQDKVPIPIINKLAAVPFSEVIYFCQKEYTPEDVRNIHLASMATKVTIDVPIVIPDISPYDYLFSLNPLRHHVDRVNISFPPLRKEELKGRHKKYYYLKDGLYYLKSKYKYDCFNYMQEPLSAWKMNIWLVCDTEKDAKEVEKYVVKDNKRFKNNSKPESLWGGNN